MDELRYLLGAFTGTEQMAETQWAPAGEAHAEARAETILGGAMILQHQRQVRDGGASFEAANVFMRDPQSGDVLLYSFDSAGFPPDPPARGGFTDDGTLVLDRTTPRGSSRTTFTPAGDGFEWSKAFRPSDDAPWQVVVTGTLGPG
jgi:hypothetical protein